MFRVLFCIYCLVLLGCDTPTPAHIIENERNERLYEGVISLLANNTPQELRDDPGFRQSEFLFHDPFQIGSEHGVINMSFTGLVHYNPEIHAQSLRTEISHAYQTLQEFNLPAVRLDYEGRGTFSRYIISGNHKILIKKGWQTLDSETIDIQLMHACTTTEVSLNLPSQELSAEVVSHINRIVSVTDPIFTLTSISLWDYEVRAYQFDQGSMYLLFGDDGTSLWYNSANNTISPGSGWQDWRYEIKIAAQYPSHQKVIISQKLPSTNEHEDKIIDLVDMASDTGNDCLTSYRVRDSTNQASEQ